MKAGIDSLVAQIYELAAQALELSATVAYRHEVGHNIPSGYPEELELIALTVAKAIEGRGMARHEALAVGLEAAEQVRAVFGGFRVYIPSGRTYKADARHAAIYEGWTAGRPMVALARQYDLSEEAVRGIVAKMRKADRRQAGLFDGEGPPHG